MCVWVGGGGRDISLWPPCQGLTQGARPHGTRPVPGRYQAAGTRPVPGRGRTWSRACSLGLGEGLGRLGALVARALLISALAGVALLGAGGVGERGGRRRLRT